MSTESIEQLEEAAALHNKATAIITSEAVDAANRAEAAQTAAEVAQGIAVDASSTVSGAVQTVLNAKDEVVQLHAEVMSLDYSDRLSHVETTVKNKQDKLVAGNNITIADDGVTISASGGGGGGGCLYETVNAVEGIVTLNSQIQYYKYSSSEDATFVINSLAYVPPESILEFRLLIEIGAKIPQLTFPPHVKFANGSPTYRKESQILISFVSNDGGKKWIATVEYNYQFGLTSESYHRFDTNEDGEEVSVLIHQYDAIDNYADTNGNRGHIDTGNTWYDLIGEGDLTKTVEAGTTGTATFNEKFVEFDGAYFTNSKLSLNNEGAAMIEVVFAVGADGFTDEVLNDAVLVSGISGATLRYVYIGSLDGETYIGNAQTWANGTVKHPITKDVLISASIPYGSAITSSNSFVDGNEATVVSILKTISRSSGFIVGQKFYGKIFAVRIYNRLLTQSEALNNALIDQERFAL